MRPTPHHRYGRRRHPTRAICASPRSCRRGRAPIQPAGAAGSLRQLMICLGWLRLFQKIVLGQPWATLRAMRMTRGKPATKPGLPAPGWESGGPIAGR